ncbi:MAG: inositol monophosphatase [Alphaproteobacteria bacterium]|nr:inositol monophosphatase [Alphaproteobacteria bacterium]
MSYLSPLLTMMVSVVKRATSNLDRDFSELERLQSSVRPYQNFVANSYNKVAQNLRVELGRVKPDAQFIEKNVEEVPAEGSCFLVNPIDGLSNFSRGIPMFATTVAYCESGDVRAVVIYNRGSDELFFAEKGNGAFKEGFRNYERLRVSANKDESQALLMVQNGYEVGSEEYNAVQHKIAKFSSQIRNFGAVSIGMAYTAAGKADMALCFGGSKNSVVAGLLLVKEAGGYLYDLSMKKIAPAKADKILNSPNLVAANTGLENLVKKFK